MKYSKLSDSGHHIGAKCYELDIFDGIAAAR